MPINLQTHTGRRTILFVMHMPPPIHGAAMMGKYIKESRVVNDMFNCHFVNYTSARNLQDVGRFSVFKVIGFIKKQIYIRKTIKQINPDVVYLTPNSYGSPFYKDFVTVQLVKMQCKHIILHFHNKGVATRQHRILDNLLYRFFFKNLTVILLSDKLYADVIKYVKTERLFICPNGIAHFDKFIERKEKVIPRILFLSNLIESKGLYVLLDALQILSQRNLLFECDFVGGETKEISSFSFQQEIEKRQLKDKVTYYGSRVGDEKYSFYNNADIFVFPTYSDCFPLVLLEAMQHGLPCISTDEGAIPSIVDNGRTGFIVEKKNPQQLADRIQQLLSDADLRHSMGVAGRQKYEKEYTLSVFENRMVEIFNDILRVKE